MDNKINNPLDRLFKILVPQTNRFSAAGLGIGWISLFLIALFGTRLHYASRGLTQSEQVMELNSRYYYWPTLTLSFLFLMYAFIGVTDRIRLVLVSLIAGVLVFFVFFGQISDMDHRMAHILYGKCIGHNPNGIPFSGYPFTLISLGFIIYVICQSVIARYKNL